MKSKPRSGKRPYRPSLFHNRILMSLLPGLGFPLALTFAYSSTLNFAPLWVWLITLNLTLIALMGKDKLAAIKAWPRTPEFTLLLLTFLGATPGILVARFLFSHKTTKPSFVYTLYGLILVQAVCAWYFWPQLQPWL